MFLHEEPDKAQIMTIFGCERYEGNINQSKEKGDLMECELVQI